MIDREGRIDRFELLQSRPENLSENMPDEIKSAEHKGWNKCNSAWCQIVTEQPRLDEWIPCNKRLPKEYGEYLCTLRGEHDNGTAQQCTFSPDARIWSTCDADGYIKLNDKEVIAWQLLPEMYKGE